MINTGKKQVGIWLMCGVSMFMIQVFLGGATRLTGSGLSITEWKLVHGIVPPMNEAEWQEEFNAYKKIDQFKVLNSCMTLSGFKKIFFWEFIHRLWGRLTGIAFIIPFIIFLIQKKIDRVLGKKLVALFLLGALQGFVGWVMVKSGLLPDTLYVNPVKLSIHLSLAVILIACLLWVALSCLQLKKELKPSLPLFRKFSLFLFIIISLQLIYGGLMAGHHAALNYPTWPKIGASWLPADLFGLSPLIKNFFYNIGLIQLIHRSVAYIIFISAIIYWFRFRKENKTPFLSNCFNMIPILVLIQVLLGILTLLKTETHIPLTLALLHQVIGLSLLLILLCIIYQSGKQAIEKNPVQPV